MPAPSRGLGHPPDSDPSARRRVERLRNRPGRRPPISRAGRAASPIRQRRWRRSSPCFKKSRPTPAAKCWPTASRGQRAAAGRDRSICATTGVESTINVPRPADGDFAARYGELHEQLYGYRREGRPLEIVAARVEVVGTLPEPPDPAVEPVAAAARSRRRRPKPGSTASRTQRRSSFARKFARATNSTGRPSSASRPRPWWSIPAFARRFYRGASC